MLAQTVPPPPPPPPPPGQIIETDQKADSSVVFIAVENPAMFPGGDIELRKYIREHIVYPQYCIEIGASGTVWISVTVETDGSLSDIEALKEVKECPALAKEALRLVKNMPRWIPGSHNGKVVRMKMNIPVRFVLN